MGKEDDMTPEKLIEHFEKIKSLKLEMERDTLRAELSSDNLTPLGKSIIESSMYFMRDMEEAERVFYPAYQTNKPSKRIMRCFYILKLKWVC